MLAFDVFALEVGKPIGEAMYQTPNNFVRNGRVRVDHPSPVYRGPTLDGNPEHLARFVNESDSEPPDVPALLGEFYAAAVLGAALCLASLAVWLLRMRVTPEKLHLRPRA